jgi:hypothetical protein
MIRGPKSKKEQFGKALEKVCKFIPEPITDEIVNELFEFVIVTSCVTRPAEGITYRCMAEEIERVTGMKVDMEKFFSKR